MGGVVIWRWTKAVHCRCKAVITHRSVFVLLVDCRREVRRLLCITKEELKFAKMYYCTRVTRFLVGVQFLPETTVRPV